jgi:hypothetical protein
MTSRNCERSSCGCESGPIMAEPSQVGSAPCSGRGHGVADAYAPERFGRGEAAAKYS